MSSKPRPGLGRAIGEVQERSIGLNRLERRTMNDHDQELIRP
jgi:hypothetical protein